MPNDTFKTEDITLVAYLKVKGFECQSKERKNGGCCWIFTDRLDSMEDILDEYEAYEAAVEPRDFNRKLALVRRDMYEFLGHTRDRVRR